MLITHCLEYCSFIRCFKVGKMSPPKFFRLALAFPYKFRSLHLDSLHFHTNLDQVTNFWKKKKKKTAKIFIGIALKLFTSLARIGIFKLLSLPIHEHRMSFHSYRSSLISSNNVNFKCICLSLLSIRYNPKPLLFGANLNKFISLIHF